jgi:hypothetical protein
VRKDGFAVDSRDEAVENEAGEVSAAAVPAGAAVAADPKEVPGDAE